MLTSLSNVLEIFMLVCFGLSWPMAAVKSIKSRSTKSTSLPFILLILAGYIGGVASKFLRGNLDKDWYVLIAYFINIVSVSTNIVVYFINRRREKQAQAETQRESEPGDSQKSE